MTHEPTPPEAELAKLADGSLPADREAELRAQVVQSPSLAAALAEQERAVALLRALDEPAPDALRARVEALTGGASSNRTPTRAVRGRRIRRTLVLPGATGPVSIW
jgi:anti-sigma factor RsiW